jgi:hypothetical protein
MVCKEEDISEVSNISSTMTKLSYVDGCVNRSNQLLSVEEVLKKLGKSLSDDEKEQNTSNSQQYSLSSTRAGFPEDTIKNSCVNDGLGNECNNSAEVPENYESGYDISLLATKNFSSIKHQLLKEPKLPKISHILCNSSNLEPEIKTETISSLYTGNNAYGVLPAPTIAHPSTLEQISAEFVALDKLQPRLNKR